MKKLITLFLLPMFYVVSAQTIISTLHKLPPAGIQQLKLDYPYIRSQQLSGNNWEDYQLYTWEKASNTDTIELMLTSSWQPDSNTWKDIQSEKNSFTLDNQERVSIHVNDVIYDFGGPSKYQTKTKYVYSYLDGSNPVKVRMQYAQPPSSNAYYNSADVFLFYDQNGRRMYDSTYLYGNGVRLRDYFKYDINGLLVNRYTLREADTIRKEYLSYDSHNNLTTFFSITLNTSTDEWEPKNADTLTYDNTGHPLTHTHWGSLISQNNPDEPYFSAISNEFYHYNADGKMDETIYQSGTSGTGWVNQYKITVEYDNTGKPVMGYLYNSAGNGWNSLALTRYLFEFPTGIMDETAEKNAVNVYPNPSQNILTIGLGGPSQKIHRVMLYNVMGQCIYESARGEPNIDVSVFNNGIYIVKVTTEQGIASCRVMVQH